MSANWLYLTLAIAMEIVATSALKESQGLRRLLPSAVALVGYVIAFGALARALRTIPLGVAYAIWSGTGIAVLTLVGVLVYRDTIGLAQGAGIALICAGIALVYLAR